TCASAIRSSTSAAAGRRRHIRATRSVASRSSPPTVAAGRAELLLLDAVEIAARRVARLRVGEVPVEVVLRRVADVGDVGAETGPAAAVAGRRADAIAVGVEI